jgi:hypothetical protein
MTGTPFRTMLAPINASTGDGRRFATGSMTLADMPMPFEWARAREGGHDGAVSIGAIQAAKIMSVKDALAGDWISPEAAKGMDPAAQGVFARGVMYDDASREDMPRLAEDVAEAMHLATNGTLGPSVDLDSFEAIPVMAGSDEELSWEAVEEYMEANDGAEPPIELLITAGRVRAATLVSIPAFAETSRPFELLPAEETADGEAAADTLALQPITAAMTASAAGALPEVGAFALPALDGPTAITWDWANGRVFGHIATWATCHVGYEGVCVTPPKEEDTYAWFNRHPVETTDGGTIAAGRITLGGRHAALALSASAAMSAYDTKTTAAHVRAYADEHGIVVAGVIEPGLSGADRAVLDRRKVSGDWRDIGSGLSLVEVLALSPGPRAHSEPGFPVVETHVGARGRQTALVASLGPEPTMTLAARPMSVEAIVRRTLAAERAETARLAEEATARETLARTVEADDNSRAEAARGALVLALGEE